MAQHPDRKSYIGSSDARDLSQGNWRKVWLEKTGRAQPEDLSRVFKVQLGLHTEPFHLSWVTGLMHEAGEIVGYSISQDFRRHPTMPYVAATLDGWVQPTGREHAPVEVKHSSGRRSMEELAEFYMPQLQHHLLVSGADRLLFSVIQGNEEPTRMWIGASPEWEAHLTDTYVAFWKLVTEDMDPGGPIHMPDTAGGAAPSVDAVPLNGMVARDASTDNAFAVLAGDYLETLDAAKRHEEAKTALKASVKPNEREVYNGLLTIKRDARGALRFTVKPRKIAAE